LSIDSRSANIADDQSSDVSITPIRTLSETPSHFVFDDLRQHLLCRFLYTSVATFLEAPDTISVDAVLSLV